MLVTVHPLQEIVAGAQEVKHNESAKKVSGSAEKEALLQLWDLDSVKNFTRMQEEYRFLTGMVASLEEVEEEGEQLILIGSL